jgi:hypothetical protein
MRYAAAGNLFTLKMAMSRSHTYSHTTSAQPAAVGMSSQKTPHLVAENRESGRWPGPLLTVLDARECHALCPRASNTERIRGSNLPHPRFVGRRCLSKPASSQPGESLAWIPHGGIFAR